MQYSRREFDDAKKARKLYHIIGCPTTDNFKKLIQMNAIRNCTVTVQDIENAERIFGKDIGTLKGKTTRPKLPRVRFDNIKIPSEMIMKNKELVWNMDILYINGLPMLTGIDSRIKFRGLVSLNGRNEEELY